MNDRLFRSIFESANDAILAISVDGVIEAWNAGAERLFGYTAEEAIGTHVMRLVPRDDRREAMAMMRRVAAGGSIEAFEARRLNRAGEVAEVAMNASPIRDEHGAVVGAAIVVRDISSLKDLEAELREMALRDPLTGLYNRRHFEAELERELALSRRTGRSGALFVLDLDHFKAVNDTFGHAAGDEMLRSVATILSKRLRASDLLARIGGDEFAAILPDVDAMHALAIARGLEQRVAALRGGRSATIMTSASIGIAAYDGKTPVAADALMEIADAAMYARKRESVTT